MRKTVLITGASHGIGKATATAFARSGYNVAVNYSKSKAEAEELCAELEKYGVKTAAFQADVSDKGAVEKMYADVKSHIGAAGILVNNTGIAEQALFSDITEEMWDKMFAVNVKGAYNCAQAVLPEMIHEKWGRIINVSSIWGISGASCEVHYSASKAALIGFTRALAKELGPSGITVNCAAPGVIDTKMNSHLSPDIIKELKNETALCRIGSPDEVANAILFLAGDGASFITGQTLTIDGCMI